MRRGPARGGTWVDQEAEGWWWWERGREPFSGFQKEPGLASVNDFSGSGTWGWTPLPGTSPGVI